MGCSMPQRALQAPHLELLVPQHQGDHDARLAGAGGAARAVEVGLVVVGRVEVDHAVDVVDVDAPGGHVGGHQHGQLAAAKSARAFSRAAWRRSPWMAAALTPSRMQLLGEAGRRTRLVLANSERALVPRGRWRPRTRTLSISWTSRKRWVISSTVMVSD